MIVNAADVHSLNKNTLPPDLTRIPLSYRLRVWLAVGGLFLFLALYVGLASWLTYTAYRMIAGVMAGGEGAAAAFFTALPSGFLAIFMWKALFFVRVGRRESGAGGDSRAAA